jgi:hypothetical protein
MALALRNIDASSAEETGIDGPGAWSDHRQNRAEDRLSDGNPWIAGMREKSRESDPNSRDGSKRSHHRGPETDQKKYSRTDSDDLQDARRQLGCLTHAGDAKMDQRSACKHPQKQKTEAGPTVSEARK